MLLRTIPNTTSLCCLTRDLGYDVPRLIYVVQREDRITVTSAKPSSVGPRQSRVAFQRFLLRWFKVQEPVKKILADVDRAYILQRTAVFFMPTRRVGDHSATTLTAENAITGATR